MASPTTSRRTKSKVVACERPFGHDPEQQEQGGVDENRTKGGVHVRSAPSRIDPLPQPNRGCPRPRMKCPGMAAESVTAVEELDVGRGVTEDGEIVDQPVFAVALGARGR